MDWSNESYVRLYVRDTKTWLKLGWEGQTVLALTLRKLDRSGLLDGVQDAADLAVMLANGIPVQIVDTGLQRLLTLEVFQFTPEGLLMPHFIEAQEARKSDPQRQRESREKKRAMSRNVTLESRNVTDQSRNVSFESQLVTRCHTLSQPVTLTFADPLLCLADPLPTTTSIQDLPDFARTHERPAPRVAVADVESESTPDGQIDTETLVQTEPAQREPRKTIPTLESQREAQLSRRDRQRSEFSNMPIGELAKAWRLNPTWVSESEPQRRPEVADVALAWDRAVGLRPTPLGHAARDPCAKAILELYADGVPKDALLRACAQAGRTDWICGRVPDRNGTKKKRRISSLSMGVFRALLDAESDASTHQVSPAVAALLAERKEAV